MIKLDGVEDVLDEAPQKLADSLILFCQVLKLKCLIISEGTKAMLKF